jgi:purine-binding chemotaxis protein CheW
LQPAERESGGGAAVELACFATHGRLYGIDVMQIREIARAAALTPLPNAPALIEGVVDLRGMVIPVVDLGRALGGAPVPDGVGARIAVLEVDEMVFGLRVESAVDVLSVPPEALEEPPALVTQAGYDLVRAVVRRPDGPPLLALSVEHLLEGVYRSALPGRDAP